MAICGRLVYLQVIQYGDFVQRAARQQQRTIDVSARRGIIYDRNGQELAMSVMVDSVFAVPSEVPDQGMTASILGRVLKSDGNEILARMKANAILRGSRAKSTRTLGAYSRHESEGNLLPAGAQTLSIRNANSARKCSGMSASMTKDSLESTQLRRAIAGHSGQDDRVPRRPPEVSRQH